MSNDERREKRVQASLRVRYKSATVSEFIEKHSHDISPGGVFIRSQKPLAKGSLLKIDFRLEDDTAVIRGVGRVVWTREDLGDNKPAGMGIKFIRLDADSEENIHKIISMQKAGKRITRESVLGESEDGESDQDTDDEITVPDGRAITDSMAPSVENVNADEAEADAAASSEDTSEDTNNGADVPESSSVKNSDDSAADSENQSDGDIDDDLRPDKPSIPPATVFPAEEEKGSHWGLVLVVVLVVAGALAFLLTRPSQKDAPVEPVDEDDATVSDTAEDVDAEKSQEDTAPEESTKPTEAVAAVVDTETATDTGGATDSESATNVDSAMTADVATDADTETETERATEVEAADAAIDSDTPQSAETATTPGAASGPVTISVVQEGAKVSIDGVVQEGGSPISFASLPAGEHIISAELFGFRPLEKKFTVVAGEPLELSYKLIRCHIVTTLKANVLGAEVFVNNDRVGLTPKRLKRRFDQTFEYRFSKPGFEDHHGTVTAADWIYEAGVYRLTLDIDLVPKTAPPADADSSTTATTPEAPGN